MDDYSPADDYDFNGFDALTLARNTANVSKRIQADKDAYKLSLEAKEKETAYEKRKRKYEESKIAAHEKAIENASQIHHLKDDE